MDFHDDAMIAVVCDGAGSASHSAEGALICADHLVTTLRDHIDALDEDTGQWLQEAISKTRDELKHYAEKNALALRDLACTIVGAVIWPQRGIFFHIGDGFGIAELDSGKSIITAPENGEYNNETWFITAEEWADHLRVTQFSGAISRLALMSDGAMPFALDKTQRALFAPFIEPVINFLKQVEAETGNQALAETLSNPATHSITMDDKTLLLAFPVRP